MKKIIVLFITAILFFVLWDLLYEVIRIFFVENSLKYYLIFCLIFIEIYFLICLMFFCDKNIFVNILLIDYLIILIMILFLRNYGGKNNGNDIYSIEYLFIWIPLFFKNKIVFMNMFGNLVLFVPFTIFLVYKKNLYDTLFLLINVVLFVEIIQSIFNVGIFDVVDIVLNIFGIVVTELVYILVRGMVLWIKKIKIKKKNLN